MTFSEYIEVVRTMMTVVTMLMMNFTIIITLYAAICNFQLFFHIHYFNCLL